jgi:hypothetical protein
MKKVLYILVFLIFTILTAKAEERFDSLLKYSISISMGVNISSVKAD